MLAHDYFDDSAAPEPAAIPALDDPLTVRIRKALDAQRTGIEVEEIELPTHEGSFLVKSNGKPVGCFSYSDEASHRQAGERARIHAAKFVRGTVEQVVL